MKDKEILSELATAISTTGAKIIVILGAGASTRHGIPDPEYNEAFYSSFLGQTMDKPLKQSVFEMIESPNTRSPVALQWWATFRDFIVRRCKVFKGLIEDEELSEHKASTRSKIQRNTSTYSAQRWVQWLSMNGKLLRCVTLNVDGLEVGMGTMLMDLREVKTNPTRLHGNILQLQGNVRYVRCSNRYCEHRELWSDDWNKQFKQGLSNDCIQCLRHRARSQHIRPKETAQIGHMQPELASWNDIQQTVAIQKRVLYQDALHPMLQAIVIVGIRKLPAHVYSFVRTAAAGFSQKGSGKLFWCNETEVDVEQVKIVHHFIQMPCENMVKAIRDRDDECSDHQPDKANTGSTSRRPHSASNTNPPTQSGSRLAKSLSQNITIHLDSGEPEHAHKSKKRKKPTVLSQMVDDMPDKSITQPSRDENNTLTADGEAEKIMRCFRHLCDYSVLQSAQNRHNIAVNSQRRRPNEIKQNTEND